MLQGDKLQPLHHDLQAAHLNATRWTSSCQSASLHMPASCTAACITDTTMPRCQPLPAGDVLLAAAAISYLGPLTGPYRAELLATWNKRALELGLSVSPAFNLQAALATAVEIREWNLQVSAW